MAKEKHDWLDGYDPVANGDQDENGVDLYLVRSALALTPAQRYERFLRGMESVYWLQNARQATRSKDPR
jgi:hypothetical protein